MAKVLGFGGVFVKYEDPKAVQRWYEEVLGIEFTPHIGAQFQAPGGATSLWAPFPASTKYFEPSTREVMVNFIVDDLDAVLARAATHGVEPLSRQEADYGRFASLLDPGGLKIELWQPA
ncbi:MAG TPA: VOC family protein [Terriglobales bacterium]|nr:VOC family protein [Terriglobales bacterium]